mgnify:CR=1 FL=1
MVFFMINTISNRLTPGKYDAVTRGKTVLVITILFTMIIPLDATGQANDEGQGQQNLQIHGSVLTSTGEFAGSTSIKVNSMDSVWSVNGEYTHILGWKRGSMSLEPTS